MNESWRKELLVDLGLMIAFWVVSLLFIATPGLDWAYAIASGVRHRDGVLPAVSGMLAGHLTVALCVAAGVAAALTASGGVMTVLSVAGAAYLIWLGVGALLHPATRESPGDAAPTGNLRLFAKGVGVSLLNPKVFLLLLALLPQFTSSTASWPVGAQLALLGALHVASCAVVYFAVGYGFAAVLGVRPRAAKAVAAASGVVMVGLGVLLLADLTVEMLT